MKPSRFFQGDVVRATDPTKRVCEVLAVDRAGDGLWMAWSPSRSYSWQHAFWFRLVSRPLHAADVAIGFASSRRARRVCQCGRCHATQLSLFCVHTTTDPLALTRYESRRAASLRHKAEVKT